MRFTCRTTPTSRRRSAPSRSASSRSRTAIPTRPCTRDRGCRGRIEGGRAVGRSEKRQSGGWRVRPSMQPAAGAAGGRVLRLGPCVAGVGHWEAALTGVGEHADHVRAGLRGTLGGVLQDERESGAALPHGGAELDPSRVAAERALRNDERNRLWIERGAGDERGAQRAGQLLPGGERPPEGYDPAEAPAP